MAVTHRFILQIYDPVSTGWIDAMSIYCAIGDPISMHRLDAENEFRKYVNQLKQMKGEDFAVRVIQEEVTQEIILQFRGPMSYGNCF
jgi:hypothetical protein